MGRGESVSVRSASLTLVLALALSACGSDADPAAEARIALGRQVFTEVSQPTCATCHTLADAGTAGKVGPNLDQLRPDSQRVATAVTNGVGIMPAQRDQLSAEQIAAVAAYVARVTGGADAAAR